MEKIKSLLPMLPYWRELNEGQRELIAKGAFFRRFEQGEHIHGGFGQCYILRGCIRVSVISAQGREISLFRLHSGELCVLSAFLRHRPRFKGTDRGGHEACGKGRAAGGGH